MTILLHLSVLVVRHLRARLRDRYVLAPGESVLRRAVGSARQAARASMVERMEERLSPALRERLDALLDTGDDVRFTVLNRIKESTSSPSVGGMRRLLARLQLIEATGVLEVDISWVNANYQRVLFHSVRSVSANRLREMVTPRRRLTLVCFLHQAWHDTLDQAMRIAATEERGELRTLHRVRGKVLSASTVSSEGEATWQAGVRPYGGGCFSTGQTNPSTPLS